MLPGQHLDLAGCYHNFSEAAETVDVLEISTAGEVIHLDQSILPYSKDPG